MKNHHKKENNNIKIFYKILLHKYKIVKAKLVS
jgi:hypothetical protein